MDPITIALAELEEAGEYTNQELIALLRRAYEAETRMRRRIDTIRHWSDPEETRSAA